MRLINRTGQVFGRLTVLNRGANVSKRLTAWECLCECGAVVNVVSHHLVSGHTKSCGCLNIDLIRARHITHGATVNRDFPPEYYSWSGIRSRCFDSNNKAFKHYGGRGITMCDRWRDDFASFYADMGKKPTPTHSIDRINNDGPYSPENCRWATWAQQRRNSRHIKLFQWDGEMLVLKDVAKRTNVNYQSLYKRVITNRQDLRVSIAILQAKGSEFRH